MKLYITQLKRELWENKVSFIYTPIVVSTLILVMVIFAAIHSKGVINSNGVHFNTISNGVPIEAGITIDNGVGIRPTSNEKTNDINIDFKTAILNDPSFFSGTIVGIMYSNCVMLYLVFSIVFGAYALRCLFDDRKNKDILFWRSMPVSEITNVLTKVAMIFLIGPLIILVLNIFVILGTIIVSFFYFTYHHVGLEHLMSALGNIAYHIPFQIFYELIFSLLMLLPIIGLALFSSAYARKTPVFIFVTPFLLALADKMLDSFFGISSGFFNVFLSYGKALELTKDAFMLQHPFQFSQAMIVPLLICLTIGAAFIAGSIWLRNNRYEI